MKKIVISSIIIVSLVCALLIINEVPSKNYQELKSYNYDKVCSIVNTTEVDSGDYTSSINNIYIKLMNIDKIDKVVYQTLLSKSDYINSFDMLNEVMDLYNNFKGISYEIYETKDYNVVEITYDYQLLDINNIKSELSNLLGDESILMNINRLPVNFDTFKKYELIDYECK